MTHPPATTPMELLCLAPSPGGAGARLPLASINLIGRDERCRIRLRSSSVSRVHALIVCQSTGLYVRDLAASQGVRVNGQAVREAELIQNDQIQIGKFLFQLRRVPHTAPAGAAQHRPDAVPPRARPASFTWDGKAISPKDRTLLLGSRLACDVILDDPDAAGAQLIIFEHDARRFVLNLADGLPVRRAGQSVDLARIRSNAVLQVGNSQLKYLPVASPPAASAPIAAPALMGQAEPDAHQHPAVPIQHDDASAEIYESQPDGEPIAETPDDQAADQSGSIAQVKLTDSFFAEFSSGDSGQPPAQNLTQADVSCTPDFSSQASTVQAASTQPANILPATDEDWPDWEITPTPPTPATPSAPLSISPLPAPPQAASPVTPNPVTPTPITPLPEEAAVQDVLPQDADVLAVASAPAKDVQWYKPSWQDQDEGPQDTAHQIKAWKTPDDTHQEPEHKGTSWIARTGWATTALTTGLCAAVLLAVWKSTDPQTGSAAISPRLSIAPPNSPAQQSPSDVSPLAGVQAVGGPPPQGFAHRPPPASSTLDALAQQWLSQQFKVRSDLWLWLNQSTSAAWKSILPEFLRTSAVTTANQLDSAVTDALVRSLMDQRQSVRDLILKLQAPGSSPASIQPDSTTQPTAPSAQVPDLSSAVQDVADALRTLSAGQAQDASSNQELTRYIASAQETLNATRQLTDSLLQRHHERLAELTQLQQRLTERAELRRTRTLETDQTYQQLKLDLESARRRLLAAEQSGLADEAAEARGEIDSLTLLIDSRAQLYAPDPGDARSIAQVAQLIEQSRTAMAEDQARADAALSELRTRLMQLAPRQDGITPQQRRSLADIEQRLDNLKLAGQSALLASQQAAKIQQQLAQAYATLADLEARIAHRLENLQNAKP